MSGRHAFCDLTKGFTPERRARVEARKAELRAAMPLADMYVSNLRAYIEALGGRLSIVAEFPQGSVAITNFSDMGDDAHDA